MSAAPQVHLVVRMVSCLTWLMSRLDRRAVTQVLKAAGIRPDGPVGRALAGALDARAAECRDLFALRGVHPKRASVVQMAGRSLARDGEEAAKLDEVTAGGGAYVLQTLADLIDRRAGHPLREGAERLAERLEKVAVLDGIALRQAASQAQCDSGAIACPQSAANDGDLDMGGALAAA